MEVSIWGDWMPESRPNQPWRPGPHAQFLEATRGGGLLPSPWSRELAASRRPAGRCGRRVDQDLGIPVCPALVQYAALITANNDWSGVVGVQGYRGDGLSSLAGTDPQTVSSGRQCDAGQCDCQQHRRPHQHDRRDRRALQPDGQRIPLQGSRMQYRAATGLTRRAVDSAASRLNVPTDDNSSSRSAPPAQRRYGRRPRAAWPSPTRPAWPPPAADRGADRADHPVSAHSTTSRAPPAASTGRVSPTPQAARVETEPGRPPRRHQDPRRAAAGPNTNTVGNQRRFPTHRGHPSPRPPTRKPGRRPPTGQAHTIAEIQGTAADLAARPAPRSPPRASSPRRLPVRWLQRHLHAELGW